MEQIYTIPVNEAFETAAGLDPQTAAVDPAGCPLCLLFKKLERNELDMILGASMMEPDIRQKTNDQGFCQTHYHMMHEMKNRLGLALMLESHLDELHAALTGGSLTEKINQLIGQAGTRRLKRIDRLSDSCYICARIEHHFAKMLETAVLLWDTDQTFAAKFRAAPYICLPHYARLIESAAARLPKKKIAAFYSDAATIVDSYMKQLRADVSWFCKKFDYRYEDEPWGNAKDAPIRAIRFLVSDEHYL